MSESRLQQEPELQDGGFMKKRVAAIPAEIARRTLFRMRAGLCKIQRPADRGCGVPSPKNLSP
jgi:hypothetical protein